MPRVGTPWIAYHGYFIKTQQGATPAISLCKCLAQNAQKMGCFSAG